MKNQNVAIVGLGRVGAVFLTRILQFKNSGITVVCAVELQDTVGTKIARKAGVKLVEMDEMVAMSAQIEVIFDFTNSEETRQLLREKLAAQGNHYTVVAPENIAQLLWKVMENKAPLPDLHGQKGY
jgi:dihydrodipicolinate reductase